MPNITRWHAYCGCIFDLESNEGQENKFLMINRLCKKHQPLASKTFKAQHSQLSSRVFSFVENAKRGNIERAVDAFNNALLEQEKKDAQNAIEQNKVHNARIHAEFQELLSKPHAFDSEIYDIVLEEHHKQQ